MSGIGAEHHENDVFFLALETMHRADPFSHFDSLGGAERIFPSESIHAAWARACFRLFLTSLNGEMI